MNEKVQVFCHDCLLPYDDPGFADFVVPDDVWANISPTGDEGGILCARCIFRRLEALGIKCDGRFTSGPCAQHEWKKPNAARDVLSEIADALNVKVNHAPVEFDWQAVCRPDLYATEVVDAAKARILARLLPDAELVAWDQAIAWHAYGNFGESEVSWVVDEEGEAYDWQRQGLTVRPLGYIDTATVVPTDNDVEPVVFHGLPHEDEPSRFVNLYRTTGGSRDWTRHKTRDEAERVAKAKQHEWECSVLALPIHPPADAPKHRDGCPLSHIPPSIASCECSVADAPRVEGDWLWGKLMDWCKKMRTSPASHPELFAIVAEARGQVSGNQEVWRNPETDKPEQLERVILLLSNCHDMYAVSGSRCTAADPKMNGRYFADADVPGGYFVLGWMPWPDAEAPSIENDTLLIDVMSSHQYRDAVNAKQGGRNGE